LFSFSERVYNEFLDFSAEDANDERAVSLMLRPVNYISIDQGTAYSQEFMSLLLREPAVFENCIANLNSQIKKKMKGAFWKKGGR